MNILSRIRDIRPRVKYMMSRIRDNRPMSVKAQLPWDLWLRKQPCPRATPSAQHFTAINPSQLCFNYY